jgi:hypothetical protein
MGVSKPSRELANESLITPTRMCPITRQCLVRDYFAPCYEKPPPASVTLQDFGLLYSIFALGERASSDGAMIIHAKFLPYIIGMLHNPEVPNHGQVAAKYASLSRACLAVGDFITNTSLSAIDALLLGAGYHYSADDPTESHKGMVLIGVALKLAVGVSTLAKKLHMTLNLLAFRTDWAPVSTCSDPIPHK